MPAGPNENSSVDLGDELVGLAGYNCAGVQPLLSRGIFPTSQRPAKTKGASSFVPIEYGEFLRKQGKGDLAREVEVRGQ
jgi:hypothetical protein